MSKKKVTMVLLVAVPLVVAHGIVAAGIIDPCLSNDTPVDCFGGPHGSFLWACYFACPQGDTYSFEEAGFCFPFTIVDLNGDPVPDIPASDFWLIDCDPVLSLTLCAGSASSAADSATNDNGQTWMTMSALAAGGCADGLTPVVQGHRLEDENNNCEPYCHDIRVRSPDMNGDLVINIQDLAMFAAGFPPNPYDKCTDFDCNFVVNVQDLAAFAFHFGPPGHACQ